MSLRRLFIYLLIASVAVSALIAIGVILFGDFGALEVRVVFTTLTITCTSVFGLACGSSMEAGRARLLPWFGIVISIVTAAMCFLIIWNVYDRSEVFVKTFVTGLLLSAAFSYLSLISLARLDRKFALVIFATPILVALLCVTLLYIIWFEPQGESDIVYRILGVEGILLASISVVTPVLHKLSSSDSDLVRIDNDIAALESRLADLKERRRSLVQEEE